MAKWEYMSVIHRFVYRKGAFHPVDLWSEKGRDGFSTMDILNEKGNEGWEAVSAEILYMCSRELGPPATPVMIYTLKRQIE